MRIDVQIDQKELLLRMRNGEKRLAYAAVNAVNNTAKRVQQAARAHLEQTFKLRKKDFMLRQAAVIKPFASVRQSRPYAEVAPGKKPRLLLPLYERGGKRDPFVGKRVAVPITGSAARPTLSTSVPKEFQIQRLLLKPMLTRGQRAQRRKLRGASAQATSQARAAFTASVGAGKIRQGRQRTYMIPWIGIFRRLGKGKRNTEMIYFFDSSVRVGAVLEFLKTAQKTARQWFKEEVEKEVIKAIEHDRGRSL